MDACFVILWVLCSFYAWGSAMAYSTRVTKTSARENLGICVLLALAGPVGAFLAAIIGDFNLHGWTLWKAK